jgi:hypothetical protein
MLIRNKLHAENIANLVVTILKVEQTIRNKLHAENIANLVVTILKVEQTRL